MNLKKYSITSAIFLSLSVISLGIGIYFTIIGNNYHATNLAEGIAYIYIILLCACVSFITYIISLVFFIIGISLLSKYKSTKKHIE